MQKTIFVGKFGKTRQTVTGDECIALQMVSINRAQRKKYPSKFIWGNVGDNLAKDIDSARRKSYVKCIRKYHRPRKMSTYVGCELTMKGMKALTKCGGTVFGGRP